MNSGADPGPASRSARTRGVYALFLRAGAILPGVQPGKAGLLYIGLAANSDGLKGRCHFHGRTANHSPRKSLAALLRDELSLRPVLVTKPNASDTWGLDRPSDARLTDWMHANLTSRPEARETELVCQCEARFSSSENGQKVEQKPNQSILAYWPFTHGLTHNATTTERRQFL